MSAPEPEDPDSDPRSSPAPRARGRRAARGPGWPRALLLDLDGTVVDSLPDIAAAANAALAQLGRDALGLERVRACIGHGADWLMAGVLRAQPGEEALVQRGVELFGRYYDEHPADLTRLFPGWQPLLEDCLRDGIGLAVVSNKPERVCRPVLEQLGLAAHFPIVIGDGSGFALKPSTEPFRAALAALDCRAEDALMVGDGIPDVEGAQAAEVPVAAAAWGYTAPRTLAALQPDWLLADVAELRALLSTARV